MKRTAPMADAEALAKAYAGAAHVRIHGLDRSSAEKLYSRTLSFVTSFAVSGKLLDVGCGSGWLAYLFALRGFDTHGIDLNPAAFEVSGIPNLSLRKGSGADIPYADGSFDIVLANTVLEHVPDPETVMSEMCRVTRPGGLLIITGPNLIALGPSLKMLFSCWSHRPFHELFFRHESMPRFPFGSTIPEVFGTLVENIGRWLCKIGTLHPVYQFRRPDLRPPFHADNDAIYLCNPLDVTRFLTSQGFRILRDVDLGRPRVTLLLAGGTWVAARAPERP